MGREDNFFLLGGHSLLGAQLIVRARERFGVQLTLRDLFETQTVAKLAERIEREADHEPELDERGRSHRILALLERRMSNVGANLDVELSLCQLLTRP